MQSNHPHIDIPHSVFLGPQWLVYAYLRLIVTFAELSLQVHCTLLPAPSESYKLTNTQYNCFNFGQTNGYTCLPWGSVNCLMATKHSQFFPCLYLFLSFALYSHWLLVVDSIKGETLHTDVQMCTSVDKHVGRTLPSGEI